MYLMTAYASVAASAAATGDAAFGTADTAVPKFSAAVANFGTASAAVPKFWYSSTFKCL